MLKYLDSFQIVMVIYVTLGVGAVFGFIKFFTEESMKRVRRLLFMIPIGNMLFYEIATSPLNKDTWMTFLHALIIQVILHGLAYLYAFIYHPNQTVLEKFIITSISFTESDFFWYGYPLSQILFTQSINNYSATAMFVQTLLVHSLHMILVLLYIPDSVESFNRMTDPVQAEEAPLDQKENKEEPVEDQPSDHMELQDNPSQNEFDDPKATEEKKDEPKEVDKIGNPSISDTPDDVTKSEKAKENKDENSNSSTPEIHVEEGKDEVKPEDVPPPEPEVPAKLGYSKLFWFIYSFVNQHNIAAILGIFWSIAVKYTNVSMTAFLKSFNFDLEKASICAGLFCQGTFIAFHPFKGIPILDVIISLIIHFIVKPVLSMAFCWALSIDSIISKFLVLIYCAPTGLYAYQLSDQAGYKTSMVTYSMYWGMICVLPVFMIWIAIINETGMFS